MNAPRMAGGKRLNLIQARLNDGERERLDRAKRRLGLTDSAVIRAALEDFIARRSDGGEAR